MNNHTALTDNWQHCQMLLGLAATAKPTTSRCPDDQQLTAFIEGELNPKQAQQMLSHLHSCPECYEIWQMTEELKHEMPAPNNKQQTTPKKIPNPFITWLNGWQPHTVGWAFALLVLVLVLPKFFQSVENPVYAQLKPHQAAIETVLAQHTFLLAASKTNQPLGFSPISGDSINHQAFLAGVAIGQQRLLNKNIATNKRLPQSYQQLGEWAVLLWTVCQLPVDLEPTFWRQQQYSGEQLMQSLQIEANTLTLLQNIQHIVAVLPQANQPQLYERLSRQLQQLAMVIE